MWEVIFLLFVFIFVIGLAYYITKKIASLGALRMQGKNMEIIETLQLGINQSIHLVRVGKKMLILGVSKDTINFLSETESDSIDQSVYKTSDEIKPFEEYLKKMMP